MIVKQTSKSSTKPKSMSSKPKVLEAKTPRTPRTARGQFNFSPASVRDGIVHGSERPGHVHPVMGQPMTPRGRLAAVVVQERPSSCPSFPAGELVTDDQVAGWIDTMKEKGIRRVLTLLNQDEISFYASPVVETLSKHFTAVVHVALSAKGALSSVMDALTEAADKKEPIVVHCSTVRFSTGGALRSSRSVCPGPRKDRNCARAVAAQSLQRYAGCCRGGSFASCQRSVFIAHRGHRRFSLTHFNQNAALSGSPPSKA